MFSIETVLVRRSNRSRLKSADTYSDASMMIVRMLVPLVRRLHFRLIHAGEKHYETEKYGQSDSSNGHSVECHTRRSRMETDDIQKRDVLHLLTPPDNEAETASDEDANE